MLVVGSVAVGLAKGEGLFEPIGMYFKHRTSRPNRDSSEEHMTRSFFCNRRRNSAALCGAIEIYTADSATCDSRTSLGLSISIFGPSGYTLFAIPVYPDFLPRSLIPARQGI